MTVPSDNDPVHPRKDPEDGAPPSGATPTDKAPPAAATPAPEATETAPPAEVAPPAEAAPHAEVAPPAGAAPQAEAGASGAADDGAAAASPSAETPPATPEAAPASPATGAVVAAPGPDAASSGGAAPAVAVMSLPNILTAGRCVSVLVIVVLLLWPWGPLLTGALVVFGLAAITDWLDGRIARAFNLVSPLGRMLDHVADKLLVGVTLLTLCAIGVIDGLNVLAAALILAREIAISGLREHLGGRGVVVPASDLAKWKTTFQMVALAALMAAPLAPLETVARVAALTILWVAMGMTLVSGFQYVWGTRGVWSER